MQNKGVTKNNGVALFIVIALLFLLSIGGAVILILAYNYTYTTKKQAERIKAFYLAEAGIWHAFYELRRDSSYRGELKEIESGKYVNITVSEPSGGFYTIRAKAEY